jgi:hypothetical protein
MIVWIKSFQILMKKVNGNTESLNAEQKHSLDTAWTFFSKT